MNYTPGPDGDWEKVSPSGAGFDAKKLAEAADFALGAETHWPRDLGKANNVPGLTDIEPPPWNQPLGIFKPRAGPNGVVIKGGKILKSLKDFQEHFSYLIQPDQPKQLRMLFQCLCQLQ